MTTAEAKDISSELAMDMLEQIPTPVMAIDKDFKITFLNQVGIKLVGEKWDDICGKPCYDVFKSEHCNTTNCRMKRVFEGADPETARNVVNLHGQDVNIEYTATVLRDSNNIIIGGLEFIQDISARVLQEQKLREQSKTIMEISTPAIKLWDRIITLPVVGVVDSLRAQQMMKTMLEKIMATTAKVIILDIQGVAAVDTAVANHLIKIARATKLMGCDCIISGISPAVAETLVELGIDLGDVSTTSTLKDALSDAFAIMKLSVTEVE